MEKSSLRKNKLITQLVIEFILLTIGSVGLGIFVESNLIIKVWDRWLYLLLSQHYHNPISDFLIRPFNFNWVTWAGPMPTYLYAMVISALLYLIWKNRSLVPWFALTILIGSLLALISAAIDWHFVFRERPFTTLHLSISEAGKMAWEKLSSYPSGHTRETTLYSLIIGQFIPILKWPLIVFIVFILYSRVYLGAHYPTDAIAGSLVGLISAKIALQITKIAQKKHHDQV